MVAWHYEEEEKASRLLAEKWGSKGVGQTTEPTTKGGRHKGKERRKIHPVILDASAAEQSRTKMAERVGSYVPD